MQPHGSGDTGALFDVDTPATPIGSVAVFADELRDVLGRLTHFLAASNPAYGRHAWLWTTAGHLTVHAGAPHAVAQGYLKAYRNGGLPLLGLPAGCLPGLRRTLARVNTGLVDLSTADSRLVLGEGGVVLCRQDVATADAVIRAAITDLTGKIRDAARAAEAPLSATGYTHLTTAHARAAKGGEISCWDLGRGRTYLEAGPRIRGFIAAPGFRHLNGRRPSLADFPASAPAVEADTERSIAA